MRSARHFLPLAALSLLADCGVALSPSLLLSRMPPLGQEVMAGYVAGSVKTFAFYPLDTITTWREVRADKNEAQRNLLQYYAGLPLTLLGALPYAILFHTAFWLCERILAGAMPAAAVKLCASVCGAIAAAVVGVPFECLKHRVQLGVTGYTTPWAALRSTIQNDGVGGLYSGLSSTLARNVPVCVHVCSHMHMRMCGES